MIVIIFLPLLPHTELGSQGTLLVQQFWTGFDLDLCADVLNMFGKMTLTENRPATLGKFSRGDHCLSFSFARSRERNPGVSWVQVLPP